MSNLYRLLKLKIKTVLNYLYFYKMEAQIIQADVLEYATPAIIIEKWIDGYERK